MKGIPTTPRNWRYEENLDRFWANLIGPDEQLRRNLLVPLQGLKRDWASVATFADGTVAFRRDDGPHRTIKPPKAAKIASAG